MKSYGLQKCIVSARKTVEGSPFCSRKRVSMEEEMSLFHSSM